MSKLDQKYLYENLWAKIMQIPGKIIRGEGYNQKDIDTIIDFIKNNTIHNIGRIVKEWSVIESSYDGIDIFITKMIKIINFLEENNDNKNVKKIKEILIKKGFNII